MDFGRLFLLAVATFVIVAGAVWAFDLNPLTGGIEEEIVSPVSFTTPIPTVVEEDPRATELKIITSSGGSSGGDSCRVVYSSIADEYVRLC